MQLMKAICSSKRQPIGSSGCAPNWCGTQTSKNFTKSADDEVEYSLTRPAQADIVTFIGIVCTHGIVPSQCVTDVDSSFALVCSFPGRGNQYFRFTVRHTRPTIRPVYTVERYLATCQISRFNTPSHFSWNSYDVF